MGRKKKFKVSLGDLFTIPVSQELMCVGQVALKGCTSDVYIIFDYIYKQGDSISKFSNHPILLMVNTVNIKLEDGEWEIIGNAELPKTLTLPNYLTETIGGYAVMDSGGRIIRKATETDIKNLSTLKSVAPIIVEDAVQAKFGKAEWYPYLNNLLYRR
ncbi:Imm26 family immunity protein [Pseudalkalibacillus berkeleyi]|uniref:Immunity 26/phosphotriesterase HocA family protein n=1 Tax=Pseudalkalibacillus berkeleyi TaxID=1069813 RepID=A0ABS9H108_9BACL|nr:Imm26 family immunity protein [Pseudalkalibacillus berkeleyi]MCF6137761.1 immunity 26/phosphotriesterase HocA family protein [Pseudalkalibacillus berkeleyi]